MGSSSRERREAAEDALLALRCQRGDREAFAHLVARWEARLFYYIRRLAPTEEDAWDALQETWIRVVASIHTLRDESLLAPWLYRLARNVAVSQFRLGRHERELREPADELADIENAEPEFTADDAEQVHCALDQVALPFREVLTLFFIQGLSVAQIATIVEIPEGTVKSRLHYARRALREAMEKGGRP